MKAKKMFSFDTPKIKIRAKKKSRIDDLRHCGAFTVMYFHLINTIMMI